MGRYAVAVVILHITYARTITVDYSRFSWGGLHGKHEGMLWMYFQWNWVFGSALSKLPRYATGGNANGCCK
jgi:hypothetical protein